VPCAVPFLLRSEALDGLPDHGRREWFVEPWHAGVFQKRLGVWAEGIARQEHHPLTEVCVTAHQLLIEAWAIQFGHAQVAQDKIVILLLALLKCQAPIGCGFHGVPITSQEIRQGARNPWLIVDNQDRLLTGRWRYDRLGEQSVCWDGLKRQRHTDYRATAQGTLHAYGTAMPLHNAQADG